MGPSGAGKTTFLNALMGTVKYGTISGQVWVNGRAMKMSRLRRIMGFVPQVTQSHHPFVCPSLSALPCLGWPCQSTLSHRPVVCPALPGLALSDNPITPSCCPPFPFCPTLPGPAPRGDPVISSCCPALSFLICPALPCAALSYLQATSIHLSRVSLLRALADLNMVAQVRSMFCWRGACKGCQVC